jgi:AraC-like DNA-binding protein
MFYGSRTRLGSLVEGAYDALLFWEGFSEPPKAPIRRRQSLFSVLLQTSRGLKLQDLADAAGFSYRHFARSFRLQTGETPHRWVMKLRLATMCWLRSLQMT